MTIIAEALDLRRFKDASAFMAAIGWFERRKFRR